MISILGDEWNHGRSRALLAGGAHSRKRGEKRFMRVLFGMILGAMLIVGVAFVSDTWATGPATESGTVDHRTMVNWDVVGENMRIVHRHAREMWSRLSHKVNG
jgi:hypothetical protein